MVNSPNEEAGNAFDIDEDEDMDFLLAQAEKAGDAAVADLGSTDLSDSFDVDVVEPDNKTVSDEIDELLETIGKDHNIPQTSSIAEVEPEVEIDFDDVFNSEPELDVVSEPEPEPVIEPEPNYASQQIQEDAPPAQLTPEPAVKKPISTQPMTMDREISLAQRIVATVDAYRSLNAEARNVVAQLLAPTADDVTEDEAIVAIRAIHADSLQESTQNALVEAKNSSPVERVFYVLGLPKDVLKHLGDLVHAYTEIELPPINPELAYAKVLVDAIDQLTDEPIVYAEAMTKVLKAAQN